MKAKAILGTILLFHVTIGQQIDMPIPCKDTTDCLEISTLPKNAFCSDERCICPTANGSSNTSCPSTLLFKSRLVSLPLVSRTCTLEKDCNLKHGFCNSTMRQCACKKGFVASSNKQKCLEVADSLGFNCTDDKQCLAFMPNTTCTKGECACGHGYHNVSNVCYRTTGYGNPCNNTKECSHIEGAFCTPKKVCGCGEDKMININESKCLAIVENYRDECEEDVQCNTKIGSTACIDHKCLCKATYHYVSSMKTCILDKGLGQYCEDSFECYQEGDNDDTRSLYCLANFCECSDGYNRAEDKCVSAYESAGSRFVEFSSLVILSSTLITYVSS